MPSSAIYCETNGLDGCTDSTSIILSPIDWTPLLFHVCCGQRRCYSKCEPVSRRLRRVSNNQRKPAQCVSVPRGLPESAWDSGVAIAGSRCKRFRQGSSTETNLHRRLLTSSSWSGMSIGADWSQRIIFIFDLTGSKWPWRPLGDLHSVR